MYHNYLCFYVLSNTDISNSSKAKYICTTLFFNECNYIKTAKRKQKIIYYEYCLLK